MKNKIVFLIFIALILNVNNPVSRASYPVKCIKNKVNISDKSFNVYTAEVNKDNKINIELSSDNLNHLKNVRSLNNKGLQVAINTSYFKPDSGLPLGLVVKNKEIVTSPILNRVAFGVDENQNPVIGIPKLDGTIKFDNNKELPIYYINQPLFNCEGVTIITNRYNTSLPKLNHNFKFISVRDNKIEKISQNRLYPTEDSYLIITSRLPNNIKEGDNITSSYNLRDEFKNINNAVAGGTYLVKDGKLFIDYKEEKFSLPFIKSVRPRTAIGIKKDKTVVIAVIGSSNIYDEAKIMKKLGCVDAMNFDGGSSTQMKTSRGYIGSRRGVSVFLSVY